MEAGVHSFMEVMNMLKNFRLSDAKRQRKMARTGKRTLRVDRDPSKAYPYPMLSINAERSDDDFPPSCR